MFIYYTVEIVEKRPNNKLYLCATQDFSSFKKAVQFTNKAMDNIKYYPHDVIIYRNIFNDFYCKSVFRMQDNPGDATYFNAIDLYLNY